MLMFNTEKSLGAVDGLTYAVKDNLTTKNIPTTCGSKFLKGNNYHMESLLFVVLYNIYYVIELSHTPYSIEVYRH